MGVGMGSPLQEQRCQVCQVFRCCLYVQCLCPSVELLLCDFGSMCVLGSIGHASCSDLGHVRAGLERITWVELEKILLGWKE